MPMMSERNLIDMFDSPSTETGMPSLQSHAAIVLIPAHASGLLANLIALAIPIPGRTCNSVADRNDSFLG
jgi:hypothetical protein